MTGSAAPSVAADQRLDQWLFFARLTKSRTLAQALIARGKIRVNKTKCDRPSIRLKAGDVLTLSMGPHIRTFEVVAIGTRRGPATEAQNLYRELTPATVQTKSSAKAPAGHESSFVSDAAAAVRPAGSGRPSKRDRRATERLKDRFRED